MPEDLPEGKSTEPTVLTEARVIEDEARRDEDEPLEDDEYLIQGLTPLQIEALAQKVYDLFLDELRIEAERYGRGSLR